MSHWASASHHTSYPVYRHFCFRYCDTQHKMDSSITSELWSGLVWTEDLHLVLTLVTLMHAARRCITPVTWTRPPVTFTVPSIRNRWRLRAVLSISRPSPAGGVRGGGDSFIRSPAPPRPEPRSKHEDRSLARMQQTIPLIVAQCLHHRRGPESGIIEPSPSPVTHHPGS